jgi:hypothetical protein
MVGVFKKMVFFAFTNTPLAEGIPSGQEGTFKLSPQKSYCPLIGQNLWLTVKDY